MEQRNVVVQTTVKNPIRKYKPSSFILSKSNTKLFSLLQLFFGFVLLLWFQVSFISFIYLFVFRYNTSVADRISFSLGYTLVWRWYYISAYYFLRFFLNVYHKPDDTTKLTCYKGFQQHKFCYFRPHSTEIVVIAVIIDGKLIG